MTRLLLGAGLILLVWSWLPIIAYLAVRLLLLVTIGSEP